VIVVSSLLLTIPVDSLIASSTWRRLYNRYLKMTRGKHHYPSGTMSNSSKNSLHHHHTTITSSSSPELISEGGGAGKSLQDEQEVRMYQSEETQAPTAGLMSLASSVNTTEYCATQPILISGNPSSSQSRDPVETLLQEQARSMAYSPCSPPPVTTMSHLNALMNEPVSPAAFKRTLTGSSSASSSSADRHGTESDRASFTSTSTGMTGGASSTTGSGVAGNRMISKEELNAIIRGTSCFGQLFILDIDQFDCLSSPAKTNL
jgi:hypothetical protein